MNTNILFHVPHSSLNIPKKFWKVCIKDNDYISKSNIFMCDYLIDRLLPDKCHKVLFKYSRLFCDVEKFKKDSLESMSSKGMGFVYMNDCNGKITNIDRKYKKIIAKSYYDKHHNKLNKATINILKKYDKCILIDLHSFSDQMVNILFDANDTPDICIGTDNFFTSKELANFTMNFFKEFGYNVKFNYPYGGTMVPNCCINKKNIHLDSIMLEINKRIYLNNEKQFEKLKDCINKYYKYLSVLNNR